MTPFLDRRAADDLARRLDGAGDPPALAVALRSAGSSLQDAVAPRAEFRSALRTRLLAVATVQAAQAERAAVAEPVNARHAAVSWRRAQRAGRAPAVAAGALASVVALSGVAVAGSQSLPGEPFYGVKTAAESLQLRMAGDDAETGRTHLELAATRLRETRALALGRDAAAGPAGGSVAGTGTTTADGEPAGPPMTAELARRVRDTLAAMDTSTREGTALLTGAHRSSQADAPLRTLERFAARQSVALAELLPALPASIQDEGRASLALVDQVGAQAQELLGTSTCSAGCDPSAAAPQLPGTPGGSAGGDCRCPEPVPAPSPRPSPTTSAPATGSTSTPPSSGPAAPPASQQPTEPDAPSDPPPSSPQQPLLVPLPVPVPTLPLPLPGVSVPPVLEQPLDETVEDLKDVLDGVLDPLLPSSLRTAP